MYVRTQVLDFLLNIDCVYLYIGKKHSNLLLHVSVCVCVCVCVRVRVLFWRRSQVTGGHFDGVGSRTDNCVPGENIENALKINK